MQTSQQPEGRLEWEQGEWKPTWQPFVNLPYCKHCDLVRADHIIGVYCPEWRLRQMDGDR